MPTKEINPKTTVRKLESLLRSWHVDDQVLFRDKKTGKIFKMTACGFESGFSNGHEYHGVVIDLKPMKERW